jgi:hypothetical protein
MTHDERRLLCLIARSIAFQAEADGKDLAAKQIRKMIHMVQRDHCIADVERHRKQA